MRTQWEPEAMPATQPGPPQSLTYPLLRRDQLVLDRLRAGFREEMAPEVAAGSCP